MRLLAQKLGVTVEQLETGKRTPLEQGVALAGLAYESLTPMELRKVEEATDDGAREAARRAAKEVVEERRKAEVAKLKERIDELGG